MFSLMNSSNKVFLLLYLPTITTLLIGRSHGQSYDCPNTTSNIFPKNSIFHTNLNHLLSSFSLNANQTHGFYNTTVVGAQNDTTVYGLFLCRGDLTPATCQDCVSTGTNQIIELCPNLKQAVVLYEQCLLRYSDQNFFSIVKTTPTVALFNKDNVSDQESFGRVLNTTLNEVVVEAVKSKPKGIKNFGTKEANLIESQNLYVLGQCTQDLSSQQCEMCLRDIIGDITRCCLGRQGGRVMSPSCNVRFELYPFYYGDSAVAQSPPSAKGKALSSRTIIIIVVAIIVVVVMLCCTITYYFFITRKTRQNCKVSLKENFGSEISTLESLQFSLAAIEAATNKFSHQNRVGKGGFGEVYKGILSDGSEIAVKRLSKNSGQGEVEFKNEILLIAKLQHRNLVALLGFCLEEEEKILVYEYVTNKSLDYFLFGSQQDIILSWSDRYKIIKGTARGILYLHEHSRLKVIHRDLKPSNILLDDEMNPKISDFGLAKMVAVNETEGSTNRIVGTYGYMSPEYAMLGQYSEKSDIFSFGVIVLEIVSGKKNVSSHDDSQYADGLLSYAWKQWRDDKMSELLDSNLAELGSYNEVIKCIHIGLLCVQENPDARPSMGTIVSYFSNDDVIQLPYPQEPAFFMHGRLEFTIGNRDSGSHQFTSSSKSVNEMSMSDFFPR